MVRWMIAALLFLGFSAAALAQGAPETAEQKFVRLTRQLEQAPLGDADKSTRSWLLDWVVDSPDISVVVCEVMGPLADEDTPNAGIYALQMMFGNASFQISNPGRRSDQLALQAAGVRSALKAYQSVLAGDPDARIKQFDALLAKDKAGTLDAHLAPLVEKNCGETSGG